MSNEKKDSKVQRGILVEIDVAVMPCHQIMLDICTEQLSKEGLEFNAVVMARYMFGRSFVAGLSALCRNQEVSSFEVSEMAAKCNKIFAERIKAELKNVPAGFKDFVNAAAKRGLKTVLFSKIDGEELQAIFPDLSEKQLCVSEDLTSSFCFTSWEGWRRFARKNGLHERLCVSVAGSGLSVKGALTSGISSIIKDNAIVAYQDISGFDKQIEKFDAGLVDEVARLLHL